MAGDMGTIHAKLDVDVRQAKADLRSLARQAHRTRVELRKTSKYVGKHRVGETTDLVDLEVRKGEERRYTTPY